MPDKMILGRTVVLLGLLLLAGASSVAKKPALGHEGAAPADDGMHVEGTIGEMDSKQVEQLFSQHQPAMRRCYDEAAESLHYLGGSMQIKVHVATSGQPRAVTIVESNLGSVEVERCIVGIIEKLRFPAPKGGEGEVSYPFSAAGRTPVGTWPAERISGPVEKKRGALKGCFGKGKAGPASSLRATLYIGPGGKATSVGFSADAPLFDKLTRCVAKQLLANQYDDPLGQMVKVSYDFKDLK